MLVLAIETSCDETAVAVVTGDTSPRLVVNAVSSQIDLHAKTNGIVPEVAAREQLVAMLPMITEAITTAQQQGFALPDALDAIAVTRGPGLIGSLLVGVETAKTLGAAWHKPVLGMHHIEGHIMGALAETAPTDVQYPAVALVVSGGHTLLVQINSIGNYHLLGTTRDDAAGEAFDKIARVLGLGYPGGPAVSAAAATVTTPKTQWPNLPRPMVHSDNLDFSFSGLKTAVWYAVRDRTLSPDEVGLYAAAAQDAIVDVLVSKTVQAAQKIGAREVWLAGGVAANSQLRETLQERVTDELQLPVRIPPLLLTTDNAGMIALAAWRRLEAGIHTPEPETATPRINLEEANA